MAKNNRKNQKKKFGKRAKWYGLPLPFYFVEKIWGQKIKFEAYARLGLGKDHAKWQAATISVVKYGEDENEIYLTIESNGALTAEEIVIAAVEKLNSNIKEFGETISSVRTLTNV